MGRITNKPLNDALATITRLTAERDLLRRMERAAGEAFIMVACAVGYTVEEAREIFPTNVALEIQGLRHAAEVHADEHRKARARIASLEAALGEIHERKAQYVALDQAGNTEAAKIGEAIMHRGINRIPSLLTPTAPAPKHDGFHEAAASEAERLAASAGPLEREALLAHAAEMRSRVPTAPAREIAVAFAFRCGFCGLDTPDLPSHTCPTPTPGDLVGRGEVGDA